MILYKQNRPIAVLGADQNNDNSSYEATSDAETAADGNLVYTYTIEDDDAAPYAFFKNIDGAEATEGGSVNEGESKTITVALSSASEKDIILYYSDAGSGNATSGSDYTAITAYTALGTISGSAGGGATENTFNITTIEDAIHEEDQTIAVQLQATSSATSDMPNVSNALVSGGSGAQAVVLYTLIITDDEAQPVAKFTDGSDSELLTSTVLETGGTITINVELSRATEKTVTIPFTFGTPSSLAATGANSSGAYPVDFYHANFTAGGTLTIIGDGPLWKEIKNPS